MSPIQSLQYYERLSDMEFDTKYPLETKGYKEFDRAGHWRRVAKLIAWNMLWL